MRPWRHYVFRTGVTTRTTWKFRVVAAVVLVLAVFLTRGLWGPQIARSLLCTEDLSSSDAILIENFDPGYPLFQSAAALQQKGLAPRIFVPVEALLDTGAENPFARGLADLMAQYARLQDWKAIPFKEIEPISLNAAAQIRDELLADHIRSVIVVTPGSRSRRSALVYRTVLGGAGIRVHCHPVYLKPPERWADTWHGMQDIAQQFLKLQYYRFYILPFFSRSPR